MTKKKNVHLSFAVALVLLATSCFYDSAVRILAEGDIPWWCTSTAPGKGDLGEQQCKEVSAQIDTAFNFDPPTVADAEAAGWKILTAAEAGRGALFTQAGTITPAILDAPGFDPLDPIFGAPLDGKFNSGRPEFFQYAGSAAGDLAVGATWMVRTTDGQPPAGFGGSNDVWAQQGQWCVDTAAAFVIGEGMSNPDCANAGGVNLDMSRYWAVNVWGVDTLRHQPDLFAASHPCISASGTDFDQTSPCRASFDSDQTLRVLVTNDDGIGAAGIDRLVEELRTHPDIEVFVYAPLTQQSGSGDASSDPLPPPPAVAATTASGFPAFSVDGEPGDAVRRGLADLASKGLSPPDVVLSGINEGQNISIQISNISGTVGAAKWAARLGLPALATSQGADSPPDYPTGVAYTMQWVQANRAALEAGTFETGVHPTYPDVWSINIPTCTTGTVRGVAVVPLGPYHGGPLDCGSTLVNPVDDVEAFWNGFVPLSEIDPAPAP